MPKSIAFTICANNYLAHAAVLAASFKKYNPTIDFCIVVADEPSAQVDYAGFHADNIVFIDEVLAADELQSLGNKFNITEFCTVIKPAVLQHFKAAGYALGVYLDPDIEIFDTLESIFALLDNHAIILTPHICSPIETDSSPSDLTLLRTGVYNLGFVGLNLDAAERFIQWWQERVMKYGYRKDAKGMFYDQIWMSYAPAFVESTYIHRGLGCNVANWNLHERTLLFADDRYYVNDLDTRLTFFHYSHFKIEDLPRIAAYNKKYTIDNREDIKPLFLSYKSRLEENGLNALSEIMYAYGRIDENDQGKGKSIRLKKFSRFRKAIKKAFKELVS